MVEKKLRIMLAGTTLNDLEPPLSAACSQLEHVLELTTVSSSEALLNILKVFHPDILFLDLSTISPNPRQAVRVAHRSVPNVPLMVVGPSENKQIALACLQDGAIGYLLKEELDLPTVAGMLAVALERNTVHGLIDLLRDPLTTLYNREGLQTLGARAFDSSRLEQRNGILLCALFGNLMELRANHGVASADRALMGVSDVLTSCFRDADLVARIGEGQFAVLALNATASDVPVFLQRLRQKLATLNQFADTSEVVELRFSFGLFSAGDARSFPEFMDSVESELRQPVTPSTD
ncbi:MAG TPA: diguanylate cyclase [Candidatus Eremiobacteraceae bacterium]|nr:diguanylate cyclase [Candidatus Eremiobacteraceae bacterium]